jgi:hypothetical protein
MARKAKTESRKSKPQLDSRRVAISFGEEMRANAVKLQFFDTLRQREFDNYEKALCRALEGAGANAQKAEIAARQIAYTVAWYVTAQNAPKVSGARLKADLQRLAAALSALNQAYSRMSEGAEHFVQRHLDSEERPLSKRNSRKAKNVVLGERERLQYEALKGRVAAFSEIVTPLASTVAVRRGRTRNPHVDHMIDVCVEHWTWATGALPVLTTSTEDGEADAALYKLMRGIADITTAPDDPAAAAINSKAFLGVVRFCRETSRFTTKRKRRA